MRSTTTPSVPAEPVGLPTDRPGHSGRGPYARVVLPGPTGDLDRVAAAVAVLAGRYADRRDVLLDLTGAGSLRFDLDPSLPYGELPGRAVAGPPAGAAIRVGRTAPAAGTADAELVVTVAADRLLLDFDTALFDRARIERLAGHLARLLAGRPDTPLGELDLLPDAERELLASFAGTTSPYERDATVHGLFTAQAARTPDAVAVVDGERILSYAELAAWSDRLAAAVRAHAPGAPVGLLLPRSAELVAGALAILKAGGAYVPLDPEHPAERTALMLADSGATALLSTPELAAGVRFDGPLVSPGDTGDPSPAVAGAATDLAYLIYTSGTTGRPKGVEIPHRGVVRLVRGTDYVPLSAQTRILPTGAMVFDAATFELWAALLNGGSVHLVDPATVLDARSLGAALAEHRITTLWLTAPLFDQLAERDPAAFRPLRHLLVGGDALTPRHVGAVLAACPRLALVNGYGPTENTTFSTTHRVRPGDLDRIPIGRPIPNSTAYVLDSAGRPCPIGVPGELWLGGDGVALGYRDRPQETAAAFRPDPFRPGGTLYRSGDLAGWRPDGVLDFHGRRDGQLKVRGFRVEPGEIEATLVAEPGVRAAVVLGVDRPGGADKFLCGWYAGDAPPAALRARLAERLPAHLVPAFLVPVPAIPLNRNGKVDRAALPAPTGTVAASGTVAGTGTGTGDGDGDGGTDAESLVAALVERTFGVAGVGATDRLDALGADSLAMTLLAARIEQQLGIRLPTAALRTATVREIAAAPAGRSAPIPAAPERATYPLSPQQHRLYVEQLKDESATHYNVPFTLDLPADTGLDRLAAAVRALAERHEALRTGFELTGDGPRQRVLSTVEIPLLVGDGEVRPFDLAAPPLCRAWVRPCPDRVRLRLDLHHTVVDGVSVGVLVEDLRALYAGTALPPAGLRPRDLAAWTATPAAAAERAAQAAYWREVFARPHARAELPLDFPRPPIRSLAGGEVRFALGPDRTRRLRERSRELALTPFAVLAGAYAAMLARLTGDPDVVVGTPMSGRDRPGLDRTVGMLANTVCLRVDAAPDLPFAALARAVGTAARDAAEHQDQPFEDLVAAVAPERDYARTPLFDALIALHSRRYVEPAGTPVRLEWNGAAVFDLNLQLRETARDVEASWQYAAALFRPESVERFRDDLLDLLDRALADPAAPLGGPPVLAAAVPAIDFDL